MRVSKNFVMREIAGEVILVPVGTATGMSGLITLNNVAAFIWKKLQEDHTVEELKQMVLEEYEVTEELAERDVKGLTSELLKLGMLEE